MICFIAKYYKSIKSKSFSTVKSLPTTISPHFINISENNTFIFYEKPVDYLLAILASEKYDFSACLTNCSNQGLCFYKAGLFRCLCNKGYIGNACEINAEKCSKYPCLNTGHCYDDDDIYLERIMSYKCNCTENYFGSNCQNAVDLCFSNNSCKNNGICVSNPITGQMKCSCLKYFSGSNCQEINWDYEVIKIVISVSTIVAIVILILFYCIIIIFDIMTYRQTKKIERRYRKNLLPGQKPINYKYYI